MPYYAQATIMGHLGRNVETKSFSGGKTMHEFSVAVTEKRGSEKITSWFSVKVWGELAQWKLDGLTKGALVLASGRLSVEEYELNGQKRQKVVITADAYNGVQVIGDHGGESPRYLETKPAQRQMAAGITDDDVPF